MFTCPQGAALFAIDVEQLPAGQAAIVDARALGYPFPLAQLPPGEYSVQTVLNVYERAQRSDGRTIWGRPIYIHATLLMHATLLLPKGYG